MLFFLLLISLLPPFYKSLVNEMELHELVDDWQQLHLRRLSRLRLSHVDLRLQSADLFFNCQHNLSGIKFYKRFEERYALAEQHTPTLPLIFLVALEEAKYDVQIFFHSCKSISDRGPEVQKAIYSFVETVRQIVSSSAAPAELFNLR